MCLFRAKFSLDRFLLEHSFDFTSGMTFHFLLSDFNNENLEIKSVAKIRPIVREECT